MRTKGKATLLITLIFSSFSCNFFSTRAPQVISVPVIDLPQIRERGFISALVDNNSFSYFIYKGRSMGYEYELLKNLADHLGVELRIKVTSGVDRGIDLLNKGNGDILAYPLTITKERTELVEFTDAQFETHQVLVQRKPENWRQMTRDQIEKELLRKPSDLIGKEIYVLKNSSFTERLKNLSEEIGGEIIVREDSAGSESEALIHAVARGEIDYTVSDQTMARINASYHLILDIETVLSLPQQIAWAVRKTSPQLRDAINDWLSKIKKEPTFMVIFNRYFNSPRNTVIRIKSDYSSLGGNKISPYDKLLKEGAEQLGWDWRLLAAIVYQESRFDPEGESWAGARGLMQLMPGTAEQFGVTDPTDPYQSVRGGVRFLKHLDRYWQRDIADQDERLKFVLASYNAGLTHVIDARKLTIKYGGDPTKWSEVEQYLLKKSIPEYYRDPEVMAGYCKCEEPVNYIKDILARYEEYKFHINS